MGVLGGLRAHTPGGVPAAPKAMIGSISRINDFGLCEVRSDDGARTSFTLDKLQGYGGQPLKEIGLRVGVAVRLEMDAEGRVASARVEPPAAGG